MLVQEMMTKNVQTIAGNENILEACKMFTDKNLGSLVVIEDDIIVGIITERDIIKKIIIGEKNPKTTTVREIMTPNIKTIHALADIEKASQIMQENKIKKLPVIYNNNIVGIVTDTDISYAVRMISTKQN